MAIHDKSVGMILTESKKARQFFFYLKKKVFYVGLPLLHYEQLQASQTLQNQNRTLVAAIQIKPELDRKEKKNKAFRGRILA